SIAIDAVGFASVIAAREQLRQVHYQPSGKNGKCEKVRPPRERQVGGSETRRAATTCAGVSSEGTASKLAARLPQPPGSPHASHTNQAAELVESCEPCGGEFLPLRRATIEPGVASSAIGMLCSA